tara:strand:+ start:358 stop:711 length:354 start_codon:yes stop_codon:yes gene_type:complete
MRIPKIYGQSRLENCPFCDKRALTSNSQGVPVCLKHKEKQLNDLKCACGEWLDIRTGKFGPYFVCIRCGNINFRKAMEMNPNAGKENQTENRTESKKQIKAPPPTDTVITSDDVEYF